MSTMAITVSISEAEKRLGEFADRAIEGEEILIAGKSKLLVLKPIEQADPVPLRPEGYFEDCYDSAQAAEDTRLAARSARRIIE